MDCKTEDQDTYQSQEDIMGGDLKNLPWTILPSMIHGIIFGSCLQMFTSIGCNPTLSESKSLILHHASSWGAAMHGKSPCKL